MSTPLKDERLARLAQKRNVARFISFGADLAPRFSVGVDGLDGSDALEVAIEKLFVTSSTVNVRTFLHDASQSTDFVYGLTSKVDVSAIVRKYASMGLFTICNETIDVDDGGVSGVALADTVEFAPGVTPRVVEDPTKTVARLPRGLGLSLLTSVYNTPIEVTAGTKSERVEFSVHPLRVGHRREHVLYWEIGESSQLPIISAHPTWPNDFSRFIGDKTYGLLIAWLSGLLVPQTTVISRRVAPFTFGEDTTTGEYWLRTAPASATPGFFTTQRGWVDPYALLENEDKKREVAAVLSQQGVGAAFSGGAWSDGQGNSVVEGVKGTGEAFMLGQSPTDLPFLIEEDIRGLLTAATTVVGPAQLEWVHDGERPWLVQLHGRSLGAGGNQVLSAGEADDWIQFDPEFGLEALRKLVVIAGQQHAGIEMLKPVGITSHFGDVLRRAAVPGRVRA